ncbi:TetR/AcrR family transcriptional regulator [Mycolicibacterium mucogenicum]|uniref:TetR/AcrR family transcriptional regulator n=1 Tax=Mycolicibacterium mucogenicum TaxID=56689 RepID=UPI00076A9F35|nr:TetR family transcriptional regulator [Mycolicibacterium mucogenicum]
MSARDRLVVTAIDLIRRQGVSGTGLSQLLERSGTARRSLYLNFPGGKAELVADATVAAGNMLGDGIDRLIGEKGPVGAVRAFVEMWTADTAGEVFLDWERRIAAGLETAGLSVDDAARQATLTVAAVEGAIVMAQATKSDVPLRRVEAALVESVEQYLN